MNNLPDTDRTRLRELARKQAEYAALPIMEERRRMWYELNDGPPGARPPVIIETWTFDRDFMPDGVCECRSDAARGIERQLLRNIRNHELIDDDKVMPGVFPVGWCVNIDELGVTFESEHAADSQGYELGFRMVHPITDLERDLDLLKPAVCSVNREQTMARKAWVEEVFGDLLPVVVQSGTYGTTMLTHRVIQLMGMEAFFLAMYDAPEAVHSLMAFLRDNALRVMRWAEAENLLCLNNGNQHMASSFDFTTQLPAPGFDPERVRLCDMWGAANSQETVGVAPEMFHEFCAPYYHAVCEPLGLVYFGCCEPAHPFWGDLGRLPHLKKISISRWCDERFMGEALQGTGIVYSRKPNPNFLSVDETLDEGAWAAHIHDTLEATRGVALEFIVRDVYTLHGNTNNARRAVEIARQTIATHRG